MKKMIFALILLVFVSVIKRSRFNFGSKAADFVRKSDRLRVFSHCRSAGPVCLCHVRVTSHYVWTPNISCVINSLLVDVG